MAEVIPTIIAKDYQELEDKIKQIEPYVKYAQLDIMDGKFVENLTWPYLKGDLNELEKIKTGLKLEAHLMVQNPEKILSQWIKSKVQRIIFHYEASQNHQEIINEIKQAGLNAGIAINPETPIDVLDDFLGIDLILIMTVNPGRGGQEFIIKTLDKIQNLRSKYQGNIEVDGGINLDTAPKAIKAGANLLASGSAIFKSQDIGQTIEKMQSY